MFWDNVAGIYDLYQIINRKANDHAGSICAEYITSEDNVLECACGTGIMTRIIAPKCKTMIATDFSEKMIHKAQILSLRFLIGWEQILKRNLTTLLTNSFLRKWA